MRILFDQGTPVAIRDALQSHTVRTAREQGWSTLSNGELLRAAEDAGFDLLLTTDKNLPYQQNLTKFKISIVMLGATRWSLIQRRLQQIANAVNGAKPGTYTFVEIPQKQSSG